MVLAVLESTLPSFCLSSSKVQDKEATVTVGFGGFNGYGGFGHDGYPPLNSTPLFRQPEKHGEGAEHTIYQQTKAPATHSLHSTEKRLSMYCQGHILQRGSCTTGSLFILLRVSCPFVRPTSLSCTRYCGYPLSRHTCRATRVAADFLDFIAFCRCSTGVALHPLKI